MATPFVVGVLSAIWAAKPALTYQGVIGLAKKHALPLAKALPDPRSGLGRITAIFDDSYVCAAVNWTDDLSA